MNRKQFLEDISVSRANFYHFMEGENGRLSLEKLESIVQSLRAYIPLSRFEKIKTMSLEEFITWIVENPKIFQYSKEELREWLSTGKDSQ